MRVWNVLILSSLFGLASLFATPPASSPVAPESPPLPPTKEEPRELRGKVTFTYEMRWARDGAQTLHVEVQPDGEVLTVRNGNEARFRLGREAIARLAADLENTPVYIAPESDFRSSAGRSGEMAIRYPNERVLARRSMVSGDVPARVSGIEGWLSDIERKR